MKDHSKIKLMLLFVFSMTLFVSPSVLATSFSSPSLAGLGANNLDSPPNTTIDSAVDGNNNVVLNGQSTPSTSIRFTFSGDGNPPVTSFVCRLGTAAFTECGGGQNPGTHTFTVAAGTHTFQVAAVNSIGRDNSPASFSWTMTSNGIPGLAARQIIEETTPGPIQTQKTSDVAALAAKAADTAHVNALTQLATTTSQSLNPPFKRCSGDSDLAVYNIYGNADLGDLFENTVAIEPSSSSSGKKDNLNEISLLIYNDQNPTDINNMIINNNNVYLKGLLVANPGIIGEEERIDFEITKILTDCKRIALIDEAHELGGESPGTKKPSVVKQDDVNPPFDVCFTPAGSTAVSASPPEKEEKKAEAAAAAAISNLAATSDLSSPGELAGLAALSLDTQSLAGKSLTAGGDKVDVAKYTIRGLIDVSEIDTSGDRQNMVVKIYNDLRRGLAGSEQTVRIFDSNNQFASVIQIDPSLKSDWTSVNFVLRELSTDCQQIPFVDRPMQIGKDPSDSTLQAREEEF